MKIVHREPEVFVATMLREEGDTGIQTHFNALIHFMHQREMCVHLINPYTPWRHWPFAALRVGTFIRAVSKPLWVKARDHLYFRLLRHHLMARLPTDRRSIVYAQCPVSALAGLEVRDEGRPVEVVLVVHFNVSQADEWILAGYLAAGGAQAESIRRVEEDVLHRVDRLVFPSRFMMDQVGKRVGGDVLRRASCVPSFVDRPASTRESLPRTDLITVGTLEPRKNHIFLLHVLAQAHRLGYPYRLTVVGDGPLRKELEAEVARLNLGGTVKFAGYVANAARMLSSHRAYVHSALMENLPISLIEAIAAGLPVFAAPVGGIPEIVRHEVEGIMWDLNDPLGAARQLVRVLENDRCYVDMSQAARSRYHHYFAPEVVAPSLIKAIFGPTTIAPANGNTSDEQAVA